MSEPRASDPAPGRYVDQALADPAAFRRRAPGLLDGTDDGDARHRLEVRWALGLALREQGEPAAAVRELEAGEADADALGDRRAAGLVRSSLALARLHLGETEAALALADAADDDLDGGDAARNQMQRGVILTRLARHDEAAAAFDRAHPELRRAGDRAQEARLLSNRGVLHAYRGALEPARADLERSVELARELGSARGEALGLVNLGYVAGRAGRLPEALRLLEDADRLLRAIGARDAELAVLDGDRAEVLADAGLLEEAVARAEAAERALADTGDDVLLGDAQLLLARVRLLAGHHEAAGRAARRARGRLAAGDRGGFALQARYVALAAAAAGAEDGPDTLDLDAAAGLADELAAGGWPTEARVAHLLVARQALRAGEVERARDSLARVRDATRRAPALARAQHWYATALVRDAEGDRRGARRAVTAGLDVLHRSRLVFASAELRAHATRHATDLVELGVRLALADDRPVDALRVLERVRATDLAVPPHPPDDPALAADLAQLRRLDERERDAARAGEDARPSRAARAATERRIRDRARALAHEAGATGDGNPTRLDVAALRRRLAGRTLAAYLELDGRLHLIAVTPRATRHLPLGPADEVRRHVGFLRSAVRRLARGHGGAPARAGAEASLDRSAADLAGLLGLDRLDPRGLVVVPTGALDGLPWGALAEATSHVPTVAPSATAWRLAAGRAPTDGPRVLVAGPDLAGAAAEVRDLADRQPSTTALSGTDATSEAVLSALEGAEVGHLATHGTFRADNPLFSTLRLEDGSLTVYEIERLRRPPRLLVLSTCEAAASTTVAGDAVLGLGGVLLRLGVATVIAPVVEIPDAATRPLMLDLHARLAAGAAPAAALTDALADDGAAGGPDEGPADVPDEGVAGGRDAATRAARAAFVVLGA